MKRKFKLGNEELEFKMTNKTVFDIDNKYGNYGTVINGFMESENLYNNALKVMVNSCITREIEEEEVIEKITAEQLTQELVNFVFELYFDYMGIKIDKEEKTEEESKEDTKKK